MPDVRLTPYEQTSELDHLTYRGALVWHGDRLLGVLATEAGRWRGEVGQWASDWEPDQGGAVAQLCRYWGVPEPVQAAHHPGLRRTREKVQG